MAYNRKPVLWNVTLDVPPGSLVGLVGPNEIGKSTLLKAIVDTVPKISGAIRIFGEAYADCRAMLAYVPQRESVDWDFPATALDVVLMGTYGRIGWFRRVGKAEREAAHEALAKMEIEHLAGRQISQLSGGQQQRTFLARSLVQKCETVFDGRTLCSRRCGYRTSHRHVNERVAGERKRRRRGAPRFAHGP